MQLLITKEDIIRYRQISKTPNDAKLLEMILDAQMLDVQPLLGEILYNKILANPENYIELLEGGSYEDNGTDYTNYGLKMVLSYFAYARHIYFGSAINTPFNTIEKLNPDSRPIESSQKKSIYQMNRDAAFQIWENVARYLKRTKNTDFIHCDSQPANRRGFRMTKIG